jgi:hypothetical protein
MSKVRGAARERIDQSTRQSARSNTLLRAASTTDERRMADGELDSGNPPTKAPISVR